MFTDIVPVHKVRPALSNLRHIGQRETITQRLVAYCRRTLGTIFCNIIKPFDVKQIQVLPQSPVGGGL